MADATFSPRRSAQDSGANLVPLKLAKRRRICPALRCRRLFIRRLDNLNTLAEKMARRTGKAEGIIFRQDQQDLR
jgi:hypothetical protein